MREPDRPGYRTIIVGYDREADKPVVEVRVALWRRALNTTVAVAVHARNLVRWMAQPPNWGD